MLDLDTLIRTLTEGGELPSVESICRANQISPKEFYNTAALEIARRFDCGHMSNEEADSAINVIWGMIIEDASYKGSGCEPPELAYSIYDAFDAGEYNHGDGHDPVEKYTRPAIKRILSKA